MAPQYMVRYAVQAEKNKDIIGIYSFILLREKFSNYLVWEQKMGSVFNC